MKNLKTIIGLAAMALCLGFASCSSDDDAPSYSTAAVSNSELMTILKDKGYQFNEQGNLLLDDKATSTTSLDLSGTKISQKALAELNILPNLTDVNLSNNGYGPVFHVDSLPTQIKGLDLQGNEIYDFEGLVDAKVVNDEVVATVLHPFNKLYLPASCKYNVEDLMPFYTANNGEGRATANTLDMKMVNDKGSLEAYNTLREIPDEYFRAYLKNLFPSLFVDGTHIDISKPMSASERGINISLEDANQFADYYKISSISGIEYFINNPYYNDFFVALIFAHEESLHISCLMPHNNIKGILFKGVTFDSLFDLSHATSLVSLSLTDFHSLKSIDLSKTLIGNQQVGDFDRSLANGIHLFDSEDLESIKFNDSMIGKTLLMEFANLPKLASLDLSKFIGLYNLYLFQLPECQIKYPDLQYIMVSDGDYKETKLSDGEQLDFLMTENDVFALSSTKEFITKYRNNLTDSYWLGYRKTYGAFRWSRKI